MTTVRRRRRMMPAAVVYRPSKVKRFDFPQGRVVAGKYVIERPLVCGIAQLGLDHPQFLGDRLEQIAAEKAGIAKAGAPLATLRYPANVAARVAEAAAAAGAPWLPQGEAWDAETSEGKLQYRDARGALALPLPRLPGAHQAVNAALAIAMLRHQHRLDVPEAALRAANERYERQHAALAPVRGVRDDPRVDVGRAVLQLGADADAGLARASAALAGGVHGRRDVLAPRLRRQPRLRPISHQASSA